MRHCAPLMLSYLGISMLLLFVNVFSATSTLRAESFCAPDRLQSSGAVYRICIPAVEDWSGSLVVYAHGFVACGKPVEIPEEQLQLPEGITLPEIINDLNYAFAVMPRGHVGAYHMMNCRLNQDMSCTAQGIVVRQHGAEADCDTFEMT